MPAPCILWLRRDLRLHDHPALHAALQLGVPVIPVFIWSPEEDGAWAPGGASKWWLHQSLESLSRRIAALGGKLILRSGPALAQLESLLAETGAGSVYWSRRYEPALQARDTVVKDALRQRGVDVKSFNSALLVEPWEIATKTGQPYQVYTPYWKAMSLKIGPLAECSAPERWPGYSGPVSSLQLSDFDLQPRIDWAQGMRDHWSPGEPGAETRLSRFMVRVGSYNELRDRPDLEGTSSLSPHFHFGEISIRRVWNEVLEWESHETSAADKAGAETYRKELVWREFAHHLLQHFPHIPETPLRRDFERFPWQENAAWRRAWERGRTGIPMVDAGMRQLWQLGWMHNRVRMVVGSLLVKNLLQPWQAGARWFWDTLVDADLASNTMGWQWVSGCGADAAPYFRVFNPVSQGEKFDPKGEYIRTYVPELSKLPDEYIHQPWTAPPLVLAEAGVDLGRTYPYQLVDLKQSRQNALDAYQRMRA